jgi:hypothetical protein
MFCRVATAYVHFVMVYLSPGLINQDAHLAVGHAVEVIGKVDQNLHIKVQAATDFGTGIGMLCREWNV